MTQQPYDKNYWGPDGPQPAKRWGAECGRGVPYRDKGTINDGQPGAKRTLGGSRKHRGMSSDSREVR